MAETLANDTSIISDIISSYNNLIQYYVSRGNIEKASHYCRIVIKEVDYEQIKRLNLFAYTMENCLEVIALDPMQASDLWMLVKTELQNRSSDSWYGNLYRKGIAAARAMGDPYIEKLEQDYLKWQHKCGIG